jgi:hypothetical protein
MHVRRASHGSARPLNCGVRRRVTKSHEFVWVRRIGKVWVLNAQALMGVTFYVALAVLLLGLVTPAQWRLSWVGGFLVALSIGAAALERWMFFHLIRCPNCGFNATHGKTTDRPLNYYVAWSRLQKYDACPQCSSDGSETSTA